LNRLRANPSPRAEGFTLLELMMVIVISAVLLALVAPNMRDLILKNRLKGAAEEAQSMLQFARSEAVKRNADVYVKFDDATWCFGAAEATGCDCTDAASCALRTDPTVAIDPTDDSTYIPKRVVGSDYTGVSLSSNPANHEVQYDRRRGLTTDPGTMTFTNGGFEIRVVVGPLGRVSLCSPSDLGKKVRGYDDC